MSWFLTNFVGAFLLPPLNLLLLAVIGLWLWHKRPQIARILLSTSVVLLWLFSTPFFADALLQSLEGEPNVTDTQKPLADAIVVLGGGTYFHAPEYGGDTVSAPTLERLRFAARLQRETGKPILLTGGRPLGNSISEAEQMKQVLEQEFYVPVRWTEDASDNTLESARLSLQMLKQAGINRIYLVTHAWHMPRALHTFQAAGFEVIPAPTAFTTRYRTDLLAFIPNASALRNSRIFMHELIGMLWYRLNHDCLSVQVCPASLPTFTFDGVLLESNSGSRVFSSRMFSRQFCHARCHMKARIKWVEEVSFLGETESGHAVLMDGPPAGGGRNLGPRPMEMLLAGTGACTAYDVVTILKKSRQQITDCVVDVQSERAETDPKVFTSIHLHFVITGKNLKREQVERAIKLSAEKYCSASIMLGKTADMTHDFEIVEG